MKNATLESWMTNQNYGYMCIDQSNPCLQAGIIEEMMEDTMESLDDQDELEEEAQEEVDKVLFEITAGQFLVCTCITTQVC